MIPFFSDIKNFYWVKYVIIDMPVPEVMGTAVVGDAVVGAV